jgi:hypothetical protein
MIGALAIFFISPSVRAESLTCNMQTFSGEDDVAHQMNLPFTLYLGSTDYNVIYLTTNGTMTFGQPDANYWGYPETPSVSLAGWDWVTWGEGAYVSYGYNSNSFCIEWSVRPFPQSTGDLTQIRLVVNKYNDNYWHGEIVTFGWLPENNRRGIRYEYGGEVVQIAAAFDVNYGVPVEVAPAPAPTSFEEPVVIPSPTTEPQPEPSETPTEQPTSLPVEETPDPEPTETASPSPTPIESPSDPSSTSDPSGSQSQPVKLDPAPSPTPEQVTSSPSPEVLIPSESPSPDPTQTSIFLPPDNNITESFVILENGVVLDIEVAEALKVFENIDLFLAALITDPGKIIKAFANVGADMTKEERETSQKIVIIAIISGQIMNRIFISNNIGGKL